MSGQRKRRKITNSEEMMDALVEDYFYYDDLAQMEAEAIRHNITGSETKVLEYEELDEVPKELISDDSDVLKLGDNDKENAPVQSQENERFKIYSEADTDEFIKQNINKNTGQKTKSDMKIVTDFFRSVDEFRDPATIPSSELDSLLARFFLGVRKKDLSEYEPDTLISIHNSIDRYFRDEKLTISIKKDPEFAHSRRVLETKRKSLKSMGKGNKPNKAEPSTAEEISILREKGLIGIQNPEALLNAVWLNNGAYFGLRGRQDHVNMLWGDLQLKTTSDGKEYLEFNERSTKTRSGAKSGDYRPVQPKVFTEPKGGVKCPIYVYKQYKSHRPLDMLTDESRFYLRPLVNPTSDIWYSKQTIGKDKLRKIMKEMANKANLQGRKVNHNGRKTFATTLIQGGKTYYRGCPTWWLEKCSIFNPLFCPFNQTTGESITHNFECYDS